MSNASTPLDQATYQYETEALNHYLHRTSTVHASVRIAGNFVMIGLIAIGLKGEYLPLLILWTAATFGLETFFFYSTKAYFKTGMPPLESGSRIRGREVTVEGLRFYLYMRILIPTLILTWTYIIPCFFLLSLPQPAPFFALITACATILNIAGHYTYRKSLPVIAAILPGTLLIASLWTMSASDYRILTAIFGLYFLVHAISIAFTGVKTKYNLLKSQQKIEQETLARQDADEANRAKSQFLANMSHELRTPLNAIIGYSEMMLEDAQDDGRNADADDHKRIILAGKRLLLNINDILDFSKIEAGRMDAEIGEFDLNEMINNAADTIRPALAEKDVDLIIDLPELSQKVWSDSHKLEQCVINLLSNASKFTHEGEIRIKGYAQDVSGLSGYVIEVADTGIGMSEEQLDTIFKPFSQADNSFTRKYGGTGLGLVITQRLIELLGGTVSVNSASEDGSVFRLHFPIMAQIAHSDQDEDAKTASRRSHILIIDDDQDVHELLARGLTPMGFGLLHAKSAAEAHISLNGKTPSLIILDVHLPDENGHELLRKLKADARTRDIPVIVHSVDGDRQQSFDNGACDHLTKPVGREDLIASVIRHAIYPKSELSMETVRKAPAAPLKKTA